MMLELNKQRDESRQYIDGIVRAVLWFSNTFKGTSFPLDDDICVEFDDSYIEDRASKLENYRQDALSGLGGIHTRALYLKEMYNLDEDEAAKWAEDAGFDDDEDDA